MLGERQTTAQVNKWTKQYQIVQRGKQTEVIEQGESCGIILDIEGFCWLFRDA